MHSFHSHTIKVEEAFEELIFKDKLKGERIKEILIAVILTIVLVASLIDSFVLRSIEKNLGTTFQWFIVIVAAFIIRSILVQKLQSKRKKLGIARYNVFSYMNVLFESSIPTILIIVFALVFNPSISLISPVVFLYFVFLVLPIFELDYKLCLLAGVTISIEYLILAYFFKDSTIHSGDFAILNTIYIYGAKAALLFMVSVVCGIIAERIKRNFIKSYQALAEREELKRIFGQQVSKEIVDEFIENKMSIESRTREACIMFLDIRDFSKYSEGKTPYEINNYQNQVLGFMIEIVNKHGGIVNQILGDGFMATFGAPIQKDNFCQDAYNAAIEIHNSLREKNESKQIPCTKIGIGIHSGEVITGNVGTSERKQYSVIGGTVILASRIEQLNKEFNSSILISDDAVNKINFDGLKPISLGKVSVKGFDEPIGVHKIV